MTTLAGRIEWGSPWTFGVIMFCTYVVGQLLAGWLFGDGLDVIFVLGALGVALIFAGVSTGFRQVLIKHEYAN